MIFKPLDLQESISTDLEISLKYVKTCKGTKYKHDSASEKFIILCQCKVFVWFLFVFYI